MVVVVLVLVIVLVLVLVVVVVVAVAVVGSSRRAVREDFPQSMILGPPLLIGKLRESSDLLKDEGNMGARMQLSIFLPKGQDNPVGR